MALYDRELLLSVSGCLPECQEISLPYTTLIETLDLRRDGLPARRFLKLKHHHDLLKRTLWYFLIVGLIAFSNGIISYDPTLRQFCEGDESCSG